MQLEMAYPDEMDLAEPKRLPISGKVVLKTRSHMFGLQKLDERDTHRWMLYPLRLTFKGKSLSIPVSISIDRDLVPVVIPLWTVCRFEFLHHSLVRLRGSDRPELRYKPFRR